MECNTLDRLVVLLKFDLVSTIVEVQPVKILPMMKNLPQELISLKGTKRN